jgi:hypothetical protein
MASLRFTCPKARKQASTGIELDPQSLRLAWSKKLKIHCPLCGENHEIAVRETYVDYALDGSAERWGGA